MKKCPICDNNHNNAEVLGRDVITKETFAYTQCGNCDAVFIDNVPGDISKYYFNNYYSFNKQGNSFVTSVKAVRDNYELTGKGAVGKLFASFFPNYNIRSLQQLPLDKNKSLLDVGCGNGKELIVLKNLGYQKVLGADPFISKDIYLDEHLLVEKKDISQVEGRFDFITMHHSFEHVPNPEEVMRSAYSLLNAGGYLMIRIPVSDSWCYKHFGTTWVQFDAPRHFFLHTKKSMKILGDKVGFSTPSVIYDSSEFQFWGSEVNQSEQSVHVLGRKKAISWKLRSMLKNYKAKASALNKQEEGDQAIFIFKK